MKHLCIKTTCLRTETTFFSSLGWSLYTGSTVHQLLQCVPWWSLYTGSTVHQLLKCVPWVVFIYRFHCTSTTTMCPLVVFIYRFNCTSTTKMCPLGGLYIQVPMYINYRVSLEWSLYTGSTVHQLLQRVPWVVFIHRFHCTSTTTACPLSGLPPKFSP